MYYLAEQSHLCRDAPTWQRWFKLSGEFCAVETFWALGELLNLCYNASVGSIHGTREGEWMTTGIQTIVKRPMDRHLGKAGCGECQASCQSACKTSCTVGNQECERE